MDGKRKINPKEDFRDWIVDNWETVEDEIAKAINNIAKEYSVKGRIVLVDVKTGKEYR